MIVGLGLIGVDFEEGWHDYSPMDPQVCKLAGEKYTPRLYSWARKEVYTAERVAGS